jgi:hypothetical protein
MSRDDRQVFLEKIEDGWAAIAHRGPRDVGIIGASCVEPMSGFGCKADLVIASRDFRFSPIPDICRRPALLNCSGAVTDSGDIVRAAFKDITSRQSAQCATSFIAKPRLQRA